MKRSTTEPCGNTAALNEFMARQDHNDSVMDSFRERARIAVEDRYYEANAEDIYDVVMNDPEEVSVVLSDKLRKAALDRDEAAIGKALLQLMDTACSQMVSQDDIAEYAHDLAREAKGVI